LAGVVRECPDPRVRGPPDSSGRRAMGDSRVDRRQRGWLRSVARRLAPAMLVFGIATLGAADVARAQAALVHDGDTPIEGPGTHPVERTVAPTTVKKTSPVDTIQSVVDTRAQTTRRPPDRDALAITCP
jgi:hypothetical protein